MDSFLNNHKVSDNELVTHLNMMGGKYNLRHVMKEFRELYLNHYNDMYLVERVLYPSKYFIDLDHCKLSIDTLKDVFHTISDNFTILKCKENTTNYHIIFNDVNISSPEDARKMCNILTNNCNELNLYLDQSVYNTGLRMIGSKKTKIIEKQYFINSTSLTLEDLNASTIHINDGLNTKPYKSMANSQNKSTAMCICDFSRIHDAYKHTTITSIMKYNQAYVLQSDNKWCMNINKEHKSNKVYFVLNIKKKELYMKCRCKCINKTCRIYKSRSVKILSKDYNTITKSI